MRNSVLTVLAAAMLSASIAAPAAAAEEASVKVYFGDLDLTDPAGAAALEERIAEAVDQVCAKTEPPRIRGMVAWEQCKAPVPRRRDGKDGGDRACAERRSRRLSRELNRAGADETAARSGGRFRVQPA